MTLNTEIADNMLDFIEQYVEAEGMAPSLREIADGCYVSYATVVRYLDILQAQGCIKRDPHKARSVRILQRRSKKDQMIDQNHHLKKNT